MDCSHFDPKIQLPFVRGALFHSLATVYTAEQNSYMLSGEENSKLPEIKGIQR